LVSNYTLFTNNKTSIWYDTLLLFLGKKPQVVWTGNTSPFVKKSWRQFAFIFQRHSFMWQILIVGLCFLSHHICREPLLFIYLKNNEKRTYQVAIEKERAYKKLKKEKEAA
jgi:hypothetical protein